MAVCGPSTGTSTRWRARLPRRPRRRSVSPHCRDTCPSLTSDRSGGIWLAPLARASARMDRHPHRRRARPPAFKLAPRSSPTLFDTSPNPSFRQRAPESHRGPKIVATLDRAIREGLIVDVVYEGLVTGEVTRRSLEPAELFWEPRLETLYLIAFCRLRDDLRIFATHRFRAARVTREAFLLSPVSSGTALMHALRILRSERDRCAACAFRARGPTCARAPRARPARSSSATGGRSSSDSPIAGLDELLPLVLSMGH